MSELSDLLDSLDAEIRVTEQYWLPISLQGIAATAARLRAAAPPAGPATAVSDQYAANAAVCAAIGAPKAYDASRIARAIHDQRHDTLMDELEAELGPMNAEISAPAPIEITEAMLDAALRGWFRSGEAEYFLKERRYRMAMRRAIAAALAARAAP